MKENLEPLCARAEPQNNFLEFPCIVCGAMHELPGAAAVLYEGGEKLGDVCPNCLRDGPEGAAKRMQEHIKNLRLLADDLASYLPWVERIPTEHWTTWNEVNRVGDEAYINSLSPEDLEEFKRRKNESAQAETCGEFEIPF